jgi:hypothetical protein
MRLLFSEQYHTKDHVDESKVQGFTISATVQMFLLVAANKNCSWGCCRKKKGVSCWEAHGSSGS